MDARAEIGSRPEAIRGEQPPAGDGAACAAVLHPARRVQ
jgi:hypothetical protein